MGVFRVDLFMIGLLWLKFLNFDVDSFTEEGNSLELVIEKVNKIMENLELDQTLEIVKKLLDLNDKDLTLEIIVRDFDEIFILETFQQEQGNFN